MKTLLRWLARGEGDGAAQYEQLRRKLILVFRYRGCSVPEDLADITMDRTSLAIGKAGFSFQGEPVVYLRGVARNVYREWRRSESRMPVGPIPEGHLEIPAPSLAAGAVQELLSSCLERCLDNLIPAERSILLRYYSSDKRAKIDGRKALSQELGVALNALRIKVFRLRNATHRCVEICTAKSEI
ncbi:RNA polymerase sigma factor [Granulicella sibirica]|uniref:RNA polymerase sigma-70 region 2 domain-containing protein n=1 Tax=Granulicella sibirica TaxID=2479048 RepID=A0A4Q0SU66_9BACT|nr:sigma-70 family RNA polymerase sigma factor [Granulicella sibirica]RXH54237.1 hypothetical protein GRAN_4888 [Granulicella sibirica]